MLPTMGYRPLRIRYGNYVHRVSEGLLKISRQPIENHSGAPMAFVETWQWSGKLYFGDCSVQSGTAAIAAFERAYSLNGKDLVLETIDGVPTHHALRARDCIGGTKVVGLPEFPEGAGAEAIGYRSYTIAVQGTKPIFNGASLFTEFNETISIEGGGWKTGCREVNFGPGVQQRLRTHSTCFATQSGRAVAYLGNPAVPPPIWPGARVDQFPRLELSSPEVESGGTFSTLTNRNISWSYNYEFPFRLFGIPHYLVK